MCWGMQLRLLGNKTTNINNSICNLWYIFFADYVSLVQIVGYEQGKNPVRVLERETV